MKSYIFEVVWCDTEGYEEIEEIIVEADTLTEAKEVIEEELDVIRYKYLMTVPNEWAEILGYDTY